MDIASPHHPHAPPPPRALACLSRQNVAKIYFQTSPPDLASLSEAFLGTLLFLGTYKLSIWCKAKRCQMASTQSRSSTGQSARATAARVHEHGHSCTHAT